MQAVFACLTLTLILQIFVFPSVLIGADPYRELVGWLSLWLDPEFPFPRTHKLTVSS